MSRVGSRLRKTGRQPRCLRKGRARALVELDEDCLIADRLDPEKLVDASHGIHWDTRIEALQALIQINTGQRQQGIAHLEAAVDTLRDAEMQDWIVMPLQQHLDAAR
jgi:hypothetical protein